MTADVLIFPGVRIERRLPGRYAVEEFRALYGLSEGYLEALWRRGEGPVTETSAGQVFITHAAAERWARAREFVDD